MVQQLSITPGEEPVRRLSGALHAARSALQRDLTAGPLFPRRRQHTLLLTNDNRIRHCAKNYDACADRGLVVADIFPT